MVANTFLVCILLIPVLSLLWNHTFFGFKLSWVSLILFPLSIILYLCKKKTISHFFALYLCFFFFYLVIFFLRQADYEIVIRFFLSVLPLVLFSKMRIKWIQVNKIFFWQIYMSLLIIPFSLSILQLLGLSQFYDTGAAIWLVDSGRISGGYMKPNNLVTYFFPAYLYGFYLLKHKKSMLGMIIILICALIVITSTLRIAIVIYLIIPAFIIFRSKLEWWIILYYKLFGPFLIGIITFFALNLSFDFWGPVEGIRDRLPMWQAHANFFFGSELPCILFGQSEVELPSSYYYITEIKSFQEAHNNSFRIILTFGLVGFLAYCLLIRKSVMDFMRHNKGQDNMLGYACLIYYIVYSVTNEPAFYVSMFWCIMLWFFIEEKTEAI